MDRRLAWRRPLTLLPIETPIASLTTIMRTLSEHAEANPTDEAVLFGPETTPEQRAAIGTLPSPDTWNGTVSSIRPTARRSCSACRAGPGSTPATTRM